MRAIITEGGSNASETLDAITRRRGSAQLQLLVLRYWVSTDTLHC